MRAEPEENVTLGRKRAKIKPVITEKREHK